MSANCTACQDTGISHGIDQPDEICACVDAWCKSPERIVRDLGEPGPFGDALRAAVVERMPKGAVWDRHDHSFIVDAGHFYPRERASIASVIAASKALTSLDQ